MKYRLTTTESDSRAIAWVCLYLTVPAMVSATVYFISLFH